MSTFMGIPISGRVERTDVAREKVQYTMEDLTPRIEKILADPRVSAIRWTQYTPYFNDGETCVFGFGKLQVRVLDVPKELDGEDSVYSYDYDTVPGLPGKFADWTSAIIEGGQPSKWNYNNRQYEQFGPVLPPLESAEEIKNLAIDLPHFEDVLRDTFGDHARVTVTRESVTVDFYEHE